MYIQYFIILQLTTVQVIGKSVTIGTILEINNFTEINFISSIKEIISHYDSHHEKQINVIEISYRMPYDLLNIHSKACSLIESGVATIFGNLGKIASEYIQSICDVMEIPYITFSWEPYQERGKSINFYPHADSLAEFYYLLMKEMEWKSFALLYDSTDSLIRLNIVLRKQNANNFPILFQRIGKPTSNRHVFRQIRDSGEKNIVIDCSYDILENVLFQALQVGLLSDKYNIFITTMDFQAINFNLFQYSGANITGIRLIHTQSLSLLQNLRKNNELHFGIKNPKQMLTNEALIYDAINVFSEGFRKLKYVTKGDHKKLSCTNSENWEYGISLNNFIKSVEMKGLTGLITFDNAGFRTNFEIEIFKVTYDGIRDIGKYNSSRNIQWFSDNSVEVPRDKMSLRNITFRVLIALTKPYGMLRETVFKMTGNDQYEGFAIDVIHEISNMLGFNYTFSVQMDNVYGSLNPETGQWNGMLRKIIDNEADLAITDLTITAERENAVDFTMPFMNLGISILYQKPKAAPPSLMSFLLPFSAHVWLYLILVYIVVSILFFIIGRMCPAEWNNIYPCIEEPEELQNQFNIKNSFWFCIGAIMQQGADIAPMLPD